ncbi:flagellar biosynthesis repressor FlbT [Beijerinckia indica]|uniref:Flagellar FlbT family protein n=1 Tax=Beijerinckia indica subsp. indica (strain ATCC 9039 / DSM 1715 / NCIMB 8712) TaxID=395963 RepID=B2IG36_BEII9|nr:flagellar biosynthesis repressor FlbT [Beijerinckia indica]ACB97110.1 flagellar FlbT family protein [Beijerinckia indica subsp. indica ATCC 9039]
MHISLRSGEKIYINGAVLRADRKVSIEILNDATFLMETHVMNVDEATTPLRQLYFIIQIMLMNPTDTDAAIEMFQSAVVKTIDVLDEPVLVAGLYTIKNLVETNRIFDALKATRSLFPVEASIISGVSPVQAA